MIKETEQMLLDAINSAICTKDEDLNSGYAIKHKLSMALTRYERVVEYQKDQALLNHMENPYPPAPVAPPALGKEAFMQQYVLEIKRTGASVCEINEGLRTGSYFAAYNLIHDNR